MARHKHLLNLTKANSRATVHRPAYLDYIGVKRFDAARRGRRASGASSASTRTPRTARRPGRSPSSGARRAACSSAPGCPTGGHDYKALVDIIETYPRDELLQISRGRSLRDRDGHLPPRRAPPRAPVRAPRQLRALPLVPRLHPARPLQHAQPRADRGDPRPGARTARRSTTARASPSRCWRGCTT